MEALPELVGDSPLSFRWPLTEAWQMPGSAAWWVLGCLRQTLGFVALGQQLEGKEDMGSGPYLKPRGSLDVSLFLFSLPTSVSCQWRAPPSPTP